jgi:N-acyl-D-aspartate/D-glutamate deacylase
MERHPMHRRGFLRTASAVALASAWRARAQQADAGLSCDLVLRGGVVVDGSGGPARQADVGVKAGRIAAIGGTLTGKEEIDCRGKVVCPGFVDLNTHLDLRCYSSGTISELPAPEGPYPESCTRMMLEQGITTVLAGNGGWSAPDIGAHLGAMRTEGVAFNYATLAGLSSMRAGAGQETGVVPSLLAALDAGAFGVSADLAAVSSPGEVQALARAAGAVTGALLSVRLRDTGAGLAASTGEALELATEAGARLQISRMRASLDPGWEQLVPALDLVAQAIAAGADVGVDTYVHPGCGMSARVAYLPPEFHDPATNEALAARRRDETVIAYVAERMALVEPMAFYPRTRVWDSVYDFTLIEVARSQRALNLVDFLVDLVLTEKVLPGGAPAQGVYLAEMLLEEHLYAMLERPWMAVASDAGGAPGMDTSQLFPWCFGNTVRALQTFATRLPAELFAAPGTAKPKPNPLGPAPIPPDKPEEPPTEPTKPTPTAVEPAAPGGTAKPPTDEAPDEDVPEVKPPPLSFTEVVRRMTSLPAARLGLADRGTLAPGAWADVVVLDPGRLADRASPTTPATRPAGVVCVLVNGQRCVEAGKWNSARPGQVLVRAGKV